MNRIRYIRETYTLLYGKETKNYISEKEIYKNEEVERKEGRTHHLGRLC